MGAQRDGIRGRLLIIPEISMIVSYWADDDFIRVMRVLHQKKTPSELIAFSGELMLNTETAALRYTSVKHAIKRIDYLLGDTLLHQEKNLTNI